MALPDPQTFRANTSPRTIRVGTLKIEAGYGSNMMMVMSALESYWENQNSGQLIKEQLLYNLWKVSNKWLELKRQKAQDGGGSELFQRRQLNIEVLRDEALGELALVSDRVYAALQGYQARKQQNGPQGYQLKGLNNGYHLEREHYLKSGKSSGSSISGSLVHSRLDIAAHSQTTPK